MRLVERYLRHLNMERLSHSRLWWQAEATPKTIDQLEELALYFERVQPRVTSLLANNKYLMRASLEYQRELFSGLLGADSQGALYYWHLFDRASAEPQTVVVQFSPWLIAGHAELASTLISELARATTTVLGDPVKQAFANLLKRWAELAPVVGAGLNMATSGIGSLVEAGGGVSASIAKRMTSGPTLDELRTQLQDALRSLTNRRVLVIVDDIDRLTPPEAAQMISLIKSLGDLPNVIYLMSYDKPTVCELIREALGVDGDRYLEKIIQTHIELPIIDEADLLASVNENLKRIFSGAKINDGRLGSLWYNVLRHYVRSPRDARRYFNSLALVYPGVAQVTDPIDLMALQALQVFEPRIYAYVREHLAELVG